MADRVLNDDIQFMFHWSTPQTCLRHYAATQPDTCKALATYFGTIEKMHMSHTLWVTGDQVYLSMALGQSSSTGYREE
ncbi:hypothetical protein HYALB_00004408 [Hymenoscyphus albidus]|uniref:Uncharacterized protein n=1 Tax=Hymenoscyphus albidus TaxID=595503 RepID=A0A9N9Q060_9HELO|nr:hypothetical protein HYALB_00004408 [Hymenoscyphus albidus]